MPDDIDSWIEILRLLGTLVVAGLGAWLSIRFLPLRAKQDEWKWQRKLESQEFIFDNLSGIVFVAQNCINSEISSAASITGLNVAATEKFVFDNVRNIHERSAGLSLSLTYEQNEVLKKFLDETQQTLNDAKLSWGAWYSDDHDSEEFHCLKTIDTIKAIAEQSLKDMKQTIQPAYQ